MHLQLKLSKHSIANPDNLEMKPETVSKANPLTVFFSYFLNGFRTITLLIFFGAIINIYLVVLI